MMTIVAQTLTLLNAARIVVIVLAMGRLTPARDQLGAPATMLAPRQAPPPLTGTGTGPGLPSYMPWLPFEQCPGPLHRTGTVCAYNPLDLGQYFVQCEVIELGTLGSARAGGIAWVVGHCPRDYVCHAHTPGPDATIATQQMLQPGGSSSVFVD